jgi:amino acid adenylation domain-containing protein
MGGVKMTLAASEPTLSLEEYEEAKSYWFDKLAGDLSEIRIQRDFTGRSEAGLDRWTLDFRDGLVEQLLHATKNRNGSLYVLLVAALKIVLYKYTGQNDIIVCSPEYRYREALATVNRYLLFRDQIDPEMTIKELLQAVMQTVSSGYKYQFYPMEKLFRLKGMDPEKPLGLNVALVLENIHDPEFSNRMSDFETNDMIFWVKRNEGQILGGITYKSSRFNKTSIQKLAERFIQVLTRLMDGSAIRIAEIDLMTNEEKQQILSFNHTGTDNSEAKALQQLFEEQVARVPTNIALIYKEQQLTYLELNQKANQLARQLRRKGVKAETVVGIMAERSLEMIIGILGVFKAGGAYLPIGRDNPPDRIRYMLENSGVKLLLTQGQRKTGLDLGPEIIDLDDQTLYEGESANPEYAVQPHDLAYVIYTSGTTGLPKGVMVEQRSIVDRIRWRRDEYRLDAQDRILQLFSFTFDGFLTSLFTPLISGSGVIIVNEAEARDPVAIKNMLNTAKITHFISVPALYAAILEYAQNDELKHLRIVTLAGESVSPHIIKESKKKNSGLELVNEYGPTEGTIVATIKRNLQPDQAVTIGKPVANTQIYILSSKDRLLPLGIPGELCIGGKGVARGYLNNPGLTAEKFVSSPFGVGERIYRTGDLARWLPDGTIEFLGRIDHQVKIRGFRIELGEIENRLLKHNAIQAAVVSVKGDQNQEKYLCAYIVAKNEMSVMQIREYLSQTLPEYMIPQYFIKLERLPVTLGGKIDRHALPEPDRKINTGVPYEPPENGTEEILVTIWGEVLNVAQIGVNDDFFALGGDSLKALVIVNRLNSEFHTDQSSKVLFEYRTVKKLSKGIQDDIINTMKQGDCAVFNKGRHPTVVLFPSVGGSGTAYAGLAKQLPEYKLYCYDFIETDTFLTDYVEKIAQIPTGNQYIFLGYSAGGSLAFDVAAFMAKRGYNVTDLIIIDSVIPGTENLREIEAEEKGLIAQGRSWMAKHMPDHVDYYENYLVVRIKKYFDYLKKPLQAIKINANIHFVISPENEESVKVTKARRYQNAKGWGKLTNAGFYFYEGYGKHSEMVAAGVAQNAKVILAILGKIQAGVTNG